MCLFHEAKHSFMDNNSFSALLDDEPFIAAIEECIDDAKMGSWHCLTAVVDSGAAENALPESARPFVELQPSEGSKYGRVYRGAGGEAIPNRGHNTVQAMTAEGQQRKCSWQVCPVTRPLMSVSRMVAAGNEVVLSNSAPYVKNLRTGETTQLRKEGKCSSSNYG